MDLEELIIDKYLEKSLKLIGKLIAKKKKKYKFFFI